MIVLVLPAYNEAEAITRLLHRVNLFCRDTSHKLRVIVVDDGSHDETSHRVREFEGLDSTLIQHESNRGLSAAMSSGLRAAVNVCGRDDIIVTMDADDTHPPAFIKQMADRVSEGYDIVIASRYRPGARVVGVSLFRRRLSDGASCLFRLIFPIQGVRDYTCGYRAYRAGLIQDGLTHWGERFIDQPGFSCMADLLLKLSVFEPIVAEIPFLLRYDRKPSESKMQVRRTVFETVWLMVRRRLSIRPLKKPVAAEFGAGASPDRRAAA